MSAVSHVSINIKRLLPDDGTRLEIMSRFGMKVHVLAKIVESDKFDRGAGQWQEGTC